VKRSYLKRGTSQLRRSEFVKKKRTDDMARAKAKVYRLKAKPESAEEKRFKQAVRLRDDYTCQYPGCGVYDLHIDVHHIAKRSQRPDLKLVTSNGICLCRKHHSWTDTHHDEAVSLGLLSVESYEAAQKSKAA
jgi:5-methylcytosine-specific restriction endonuclease McrA